MQKNMQLISTNAKYYDIKYECDVLNKPKGTVNSM